MKDSCQILFELTEDAYARLIALSENTGQSFDQVLAACIEGGLPDLEQLILGEQFAGGIEKGTNEDKR